MSNSNGPVRRRRIAGESTPAAEPTESKRRLIPKPAKKAPVAKAPVVKAPIKKPPSTKKASNDKREPAKPSVPKSSIKKVPADKIDTGTVEHAVAAPTVKLAKPASAAAPVASGETGVAKRKLIPLAVLAVAAVVFGAFFAVKGVGSYNDQRDIGGSNDAAAAAASKAAETIFSYDYTTLPEHAKKSKELMTPTFQKQFNTIDSDLTTLATQTKAVILSQARNAAALPCGDGCSSDKASILVFIDQAKQNVDLKNPTVYANRMVVDMVKRNGVWLVNDIQAL